MAGNKKGGRKRCEQQQVKAANDPSSTRGDDKVSKLTDLNQILMKEITGLREEKAVLSTNVTALGLEIESTRKMTEEWKEVEKELRKELAKKDAEYEAAISQIHRQLQEAEKQLNSEISAKEEECRAVKLDQKNLEATVLQLKDKIEEISADLEVTAKHAKCEKKVLLSQIIAAKKETDQITSSSQIAEDAWNLEKEKMLSRFAELEANLELMSSEKGSLSETNRELRTEAEYLKAQLVSEIESARKINEEFKKAEKELRELGKDGDYQVAISQTLKQLQGAEARFNTEISAKEEECRAVNLDKKNLEDTVLQLKNQIQARSSELEATNKCRILEKDVLLSQIVAAKKETAEITRISQIAQETWNVEKEKMLSRLAELETNLAFMASEKGSLNETNRELKTEAESLKAQFVSEIESARKMTDEWKEAEKELRKELVKKDDEYKSAISQAVKELQEAKERFNAEISMKEDECRRLNLDKKNLDATVLKLKNQIQVISSELETANEDRKLETEVFLSLDIARKETAQINRSYQMAQEDWNAEKEILLSKLAELQAKLQLVASEKGLLSETNKDLRTEAEPWKAQLVSEVESASKITEEWKEAEKKLRKELEKKDEEYRGVISRALKHLQEAKKRLHTEISMKEEECRTLHLDKKNLEATVLKLKNQLQLISSELETTNEDRKFVKRLPRSVEVARKETAEISRSYHMAEEDWNAEKEILLSRLAELQTKLQLAASEKGSLSETNRELKNEAESLKAQLDDYNDKLVGMEDERQDLKAASVSIAERLEALQVDQNVKQNSDVHERSALVDIANRIDVHEKPKQSNSKGNQNPSDVNGKQNPSDVIETQSMEENIRPKGGYQTKTPKKSQRKRR